MVRLASRMFSAISLGVFCREAPSTRAIIRSMKLSPGLAVIWTTIRSESTLVPPVTELRSPPDSRMTGADSPVIADSSTLATPSTTSPSPGMTWPASTTTRSPERELRPGHVLLGAVVAQPAGDGLGLGPPQRRGLRLAAALGDGLGQVGEHDGQPEPDHDRPGEDARVGDGEDGGQHGADLDDEHHRVADHHPRVELAGRVRQRGEQHLRVEQAALHPGRCGGRGSRHRERPVGDRVVGAWTSQAFRERAERERGEEGQAGDDEDDADEHPDEQRPVGGQRAGGGRDRLLAGQRPGQREHEDDREEAGRPACTRPSAVL